MEQTQQESDSQRLKQIKEFEKIPETTSLVDYAKRAAGFIRNKLRFRDDLLKIVHNGPSETKRFPRERLDEIRAIDKEFREYNDQFSKLRTEGSSLQLVRDAIGAMTFLVPGENLPQNNLMRSMISTALQHAGEILPLQREDGERLETPFVFIPARKTLIIGGTREVPLKELFSNIHHLDMPMSTMKQLRSSMNLYGELFSHRQRSIGPEIKAILPYLIEALEEVIHEETEKSLNLKPDEALNPGSYLRELSELFEVSAMLGMTYFDLLESGEMPTNKLKVYPLLMEEQIDEIIKQCIRDDAFEHDIVSLLAPAERGSTEADFNAAYQLILPYTKQYYFLNPRTSALVMAKMLSKSSSVAHAFNAFRPNGILKLENPSLGNLGVLSPFLDYLFSAEVSGDASPEAKVNNIQTQYIALLKPFRTSAYYRRAAANPEPTESQYEKEINAEDLTYMMVSIRRALVQAENIEDFFSIIMPGVHINHILRNSSEEPEKTIADRFRLLHKHLKAVYAGHEVYEKLCNLLFNNFVKKTKGEWDRSLFQTVQSFAKLIPEVSEETQFMKKYISKYQHVLSYACGEILHQRGRKPLDQLADAYSAFFLNQFIFRGHVLEHLVKRDPRILVSSGNIQIDIEDLLPGLYDKTEGVRILSYFSDSLQMFVWQEKALVTT